MKKKFLVLCLLCTFMLALVGCETTIDTDHHDVFWDKFVVIEDRHNPEYGELYVVYDKDTMVMYYFTRSDRSRSLCPVYDENGNVMIYPEKLVED